MHRSSVDVAEALVASRAVLEAGDVFPPHVMDRVIDGVTRLA